MKVICSLIAKSKANPKYILTIIAVALLGHYAPDQLSTILTVLGDSA
jgi:hypothetical protein